METAKDVSDTKKSYKALVENSKSGFAALLGGYRNPNGTFGEPWDGAAATGVVQREDAQDAWSYNFYRNSLASCTGTPSIRTGALAAGVSRTIDNFSI